jgi:uncharacterized protein with FMN-binding domain
MKRALLIAGGTLGGLGAVLAITPPQLNSSSSVGNLPSGNPAIGDAQSTPAATPVATATATKSSAPVATATATKSSAPVATATVTKKATPTQKATASASASAQATHSAAPTQTQANTSSSISGTFTGNAVDVGYGIVQVKITVANGKITDAQAVQAPNGRNDRWTQMSVPVLRQRTLAAQSANINGVSGASYTSYGWYTSLVSALKQAGL